MDNGVLVYVKLHSEELVCNFTSNYLRRDSACLLIIYIGKTKYIKINIE